MKLGRALSPNAGRSILEENKRLRAALEFAVRCAEGEERDYAGKLVPMMKRALEIDSRHE